jgi:uncharacterized protein YbjQ (UPF0145 family)
MRRTRRARRRRRPAHGRGATRRGPGVQGGQTWWSAGNAEVAGHTELVNDVRHDARRQLRAEVQRLGADGIVIADMTLQIRERRCPVRENQGDHIAEATITGTAIAQFSRVPQRPGPSSLSMLSLDQHRRPTPHGTVSYDLGSTTQVTTRRWRPILLSRVKPRRS